MARKKSSLGLDYSAPDVQAAVRNLIKKGMVVARQDVNGKVVYFATEFAPPLGPFELKSYRQAIDEQEGRSRRLRKR
jgi:hypothetical protein